MATKLYIDLDSQRLVESETSVAPVAPTNVFRGDVRDFELYFLNRTNDAATPFSYVDKSAASVKFGIGNKTGLPESGTWILDGATLNFNATATDLQTALRTSQSDASLVVTGSLSDGFVVTWGANGAKSLLTGNLSGLTPGCDLDIAERIAGTESVKEVQFVRVRQSPVAYQPTWTDLSTTVTLSVSETRGGSATASEVQTLTFSREPASGTFTLTTPTDTRTQSESVVAGVFSLSENHGYRVGQPISLSGFTSLSGVTHATTYFVASLNSPTSFMLATSVSGTAITLATANAGSGTVTAAAQTTLPIEYDADPSDVQSAIAALSSVGSGNVTVTGTAKEKFVVSFGGNKALAALPSLTVSSTMAAPPGKTASVQLNTFQAIDVLGDLPAIDLSLEIQLTESSATETVVSQSVSLDADLIDGATAGPLARGEFVTDAPSDGSLYGRKDGEWEEAATAVQGALADTALQPGGVQASDIVPYSPASANETFARANRFDAGLGSGYYTLTQPRIMWLGDSLAAQFPGMFAPDRLLARVHGLAGHGGGYLRVDVTSGGSVTNAYAHDLYPAGFTYSITADNSWVQFGAPTFSFPNPEGGGEYFMLDTWNIYVVHENGAGVYAIEYQEIGTATWTAASGFSSVDANNAGGAVLTRCNGTLPHGMYKMRVRRVSGGTVRVPHATVFSDSTLSGIVNMVCSGNAGSGTNLTQILAVPQANWDAFMAGWAPNIVIIMVSGNLTHINNSLDSLLARIEASRPEVQIIMCAGWGWDRVGNTAQITAARNIVTARKGVFFEPNAAIGGYDNAVKLGWNNDNVHFTVEAQEVAGWALANAMNWIGSVWNTRIAAPAPRWYLGPELNSLIATSVATTSAAGVNGTIGSAPLLILPDASNSRFTFILPDPLIRRWRVRVLVNTRNINNAGANGNVYLVFTLSGATINSTGVAATQGVQVTLPVSIPVTYDGTSEGILIEREISFPSPFYSGEIAQIGVNFDRTNALDTAGDVIHLNAVCIEPAK